MARPLVIQKILETHSIVDYLQQQGHTPRSTDQEKIKYLCPLHKENTPSFYVYTTGEFQRYFCYGCGCRGDLINLVSALEKISVRDAILKLSQGLDIKIEDEITNAANQYEDNKKTSWEMEDYAFSLSRTFYLYLRNVGFDPEEVEFMEAVMQKVDRIISAMDESALKTIHEFVIDQGLPKRAEAYAKKQEAKMSQQFTKEKS